HDHQCVGTEGQFAPADLIDEAEGEVGGDHVHDGQDRRSHHPGDLRGDDVVRVGQEVGREQVWPVVESHVDAGDLLQDEEDADDDQRALDRLGPVGGRIDAATFLLD